MDWLNILDQIFDVCIVPLIGLLTSYLIVFIKKKMEEGRAKTNSELANKYLWMLEETIVDCIRATNQTYVEGLKDKNAFDAEAQKTALAMTADAVKNLLSAEAKEYLTHVVSDLDAFIEQKIEANIAVVKKN